MSCIIDCEAKKRNVGRRLAEVFGGITIESRGYPPLVVYYHRRPPFVMSDKYTLVFPLQLDPDLFQAAQWLGARADFLVITANGLHLAVPNYRCFFTRTLTRLILSILLNCLQKQP